MNFLLYRLIHIAFDIIQFLIIIRVILSCVPHDPYSQWVRLLNDATEPVLKPIRQTVPITSMGVDFSPIVAFILLGFLKKVLLAVI